jgi:hypothetical protein
VGAVSPRLSHVLAVLGVLTCLAVLAGPAAAAERPIVYTIVIDGLDGDKVDAGVTPFISSLLAGQDARATYYRESRSIMVAETNPNHTAMMTGAYAGSSGVFSNTFAIYAPLENEDSCRATGGTNFGQLPTETSGENANCLLVQTVFEAIKRQRNPDRLVTAAVFGKPKLGRIFAGKKADPRRRDVDHIWAPCSSGSDDDDYCGDVPTNPVSGYAVDDALVMDEVIRTIREGVRGADGQVKRPDFTFVNLHQVDSAGHAFGTMTGAYDTAIGMADDQVERLVTELRSRGEWRRTVLIVLSDHSLDTTLTKTSVDEPFSAAGIPDDSYLVIGKSSVDLIYLADRRSAGRFDLLKRMRETALNTGNVMEALYREPNPNDGGAAHTLSAAHPAWRLVGPRTPDLFLTHRPGGSFADPDPQDQPLPGHHGAPQTLDNFLAVIGGGSYIANASRAGTAAPLFDDTLQNPRQSENVDVAPTVMGLLGLFGPRHNRGRFLAEAFRLANLPGQSRPVTPRLTVRRSDGGSRCGPVPYRIGLGPAGGRYDLTIRSGNRVRTVLRNSSRTSYVLHARRGTGHRLALRSRSASGVLSARRLRALRPARCR